MKKLIRQFMDPVFFRFILVGIVNTLVGYGVMFGLWNVAGLHAWGDQGYWISSAANYVIGSIVSFFLNKHFTFRNKEKGWQVVSRFVLNISVCYLIAYGFSKPFVQWLLAQTALSVQWKGNIAMLTGSVLFVLLNYLGQRYFAFRK